MSKRVGRHSASEEIKESATDLPDAAAVRRALASAGRAPHDATAPNGRVVGVFAKAEASPSGRIRGRRRTMMDDSDISHTREARAWSPR